MIRDLLPPLDPTINLHDCEKCAGRRFELLAGELADGLYPHVCPCCGTRKDLPKLGDEYEGRVVV